VIVIILRFGTLAYFALNFIRFTYAFGYY